MKYFLILRSTLHITASSLYADVIMGVVPQQSPLKLLKVWSPIAQYLSEKTGEKIIFKTEKSISKFSDILYNGGYDFAYINPIQYLLANKKQVYVAKIRATKSNFIVRPSVRVSVLNSFIEHE